MLNHTPFTGLMAAPHSPMKENGDIRLDIVPQQAEHLIRNGVRGAFVCGTTGEGQSLTSRERMDFAEAWVAASRGRLVINIHVGHNSAREAGILARHAKKIGAHAISASPPCFFKPESNTELLNYQMEIAGSVPDLPFYHYHIPCFSGSALPVATFLRMAVGQIPNLVGVKFSHPDLADLLACRSGENSKYEVLFGCDEMLLGALTMNVKGAVGSTYNFAARWYLEMMVALENNQVHLARVLQKRSIELVRLMNEFGGIAAGKAIMGALGIECGPVRPPLRRLTVDQIQDLRTRFLELASHNTSIVA